MSSSSRSDGAGEQPGSEAPRDVLSRRSFLKGAGGVAAVGVAVDTVQAELSQVAVEEATRVEGWTEVRLRVNGSAVPVRVQPRTTLLNALRNHAEPPLTGAKLVCDSGNCGACTVLVDGRPAYACMLLAADIAESEITTVEGLAPTGQLNQVQTSFCEHDATMCGFCTPGYVVSVSALLERNPNPSEDEVRSACAGNLCRCGTQPHVFAAALDAARKQRGEDR